MKKVVFFIVALGVIGGGWYGAWNAVEGMLIDQIESAVYRQNEEIQKSGQDADFEVSLKKAGFPTHFGFEIFDSKISTSNDSFSGEISQKTPLTIKAPISLSPLFTKDFDSLNFVFDSVNYDGKVSFPMKGEEKSFNFSVSVDSGEYQGFISNPLVGKESLNNLLVSINGIDVVKIAKLGLEVNQVKSGEVFDSSVNYTIKGLDINEKDFVATYSPERLPHAQNISIEKIIMSVACEKCPQPDEALMTEVYNLRKLQQSSSTTTYNTDVLKEVLGMYVKKIEKERSRFVVNEMGLKIEEAEVYGKGDLSIVNGQIAFDFTVTAENISSALQKSGKLETLGPIATMLQSSPTLTLTLVAKDGMFSFNGIPLFPVPPVKTMIESIPEELSSSSKEYEEVIGDAEKSE